ncbi:hypothetical protein ACJ3XI_01080 [Litorimonas sp. RW-G-Af-16]|uniref:hypothetical protein n=1 Tax=Litorimonas sp. RW-G-Af-16 TaxID=3241168 RepID=UPI00390C983B
MSDYDKQQWQAEQAARDAALEKQRDKERKARERSARNARRKLERLHRTLSEKDAITEFENEFGESVLERLDEFGSAFHDLEKGRPGDALSFAQKRVVAAMNKKVKELKSKPVTADDGAPEEFERTADRYKTNNDYTPRSSFKSKGKPKFTPRVRQLEEDFEDEPPRTRVSEKAPEKRPNTQLPNAKLPEPATTTPVAPPSNVTPMIKRKPVEPYIPPYEPGESKPNSKAIPAPPKRPFLRIVNSD